MAAHRFLPAFSLTLALAASAQTMVEHSAATANATSAAGMRKAGKGAGSILEKTAKALGKAGASQAPSSSVIVLSGPAQKPEKAVKLTAPDPALVTPGMDGEELVRKFGQPAMKTSSTQDSHAVEIWWYGSGSQTLEVKLLDGKVRAVSPGEKDAGVAVLP
jgi:hypothetical protein